MDGHGAAALDAAREMLPVWVPWGSLAAVLLCSAALSLVCGYLGALFAVRPALRARSLHWSQRARLNSVAKTTIAANTILLAAFATSWSLVFAGPFSKVSGAILTLTAFWTSIAVGLCLFRHFAQRLRDAELPLGYALRSGATVCLLLAPQILIYVVAIELTGGKLDARVALVMAIAAAGCAFFAFGGGLLLARAFGLARPASERLQAVVGRASARIGFHPKAVFELTWAMANAVAFPRQGVIAVSDRALAAMSDDELVSICVHELGHLTESRPVTAMRIASTFLLLPLVLIWPVANTYGWIAVLGLALFVLGLLWSVKRVSRRMEVRADFIAHGAEPADSAGYARALEKLHRINLAPVVAGRRGSHPDLYDRMLAAGLDPDYPRPARPDVQFLSFASALVAAVFFFGSVFYVIENKPLRAPLALIRTGRAAPAAQALAWERAAQGDKVGAATLMRALAEDADASWRASTHLALMLASVGECGQARRALFEAAERRIARTAQPRRPEMLAFAVRVVRDCPKTTSHS